MATKRYQPKVGDTVWTKYERDANFYLKSGRITELSDNFTGSHPGQVFKTLVTVHVDGEQYARCGDLGWFRSHFTNVYKEG